MNGYEETNVCVGIEMYVYGHGYSGSDYTVEGKKTGYIILITTLHSDRP